MTRRLSIPRECIKATITGLRRAGRGHTEAAAFWLGDAVNNEVTHVLIPSGPGVELAPRWLTLSTRIMDRFGDYCEENDLVALAGVHSHPESAFYSDVDADGFFHAPEFVSVVVPNYGNTTLARAADEWSVAVGESGGRWRQSSWQEAIAVTESPTFHAVALTMGGNRAYP